MNMYIYIYIYGVRIAQCTRDEKRKRSHINYTKRDGITDTDRQTDRQTSVMNLRNLVACVFLEHDETVSPVSVRAQRPAAAMALRMSSWGSHGTPLTLATGPTGSTGALARAFVRRLVRVMRMRLVMVVRFILGGAGRAACSRVLTKHISIEMYICIYILCVVCETYLHVHPFKRERSSGYISMG